MFSVAYLTLTKKEIRRFSKIWIQTILPPMVTSSLYFMIFGVFLSSQMPKDFGSYTAFLAPGLIMMAIINNAFANTASSFFQAKMLKHLEELLVSSMTPFTMLMGFLTGGVVRGLFTGLGVLVVSLLFAPFSIHHWGVVLFFSIGTSLLFALLGLINGVYAKTFDDISIIPTFFLTPMIYLGGVFFPLSVLSDFWKNIALYNPLVYIIDGFRFGVLGSSDISIFLSSSVLLASCLVSFLICWRLMQTGKNIVS